MTATTFEATTIEGAPRRLVEDAWNILNRTYAIGTGVLLAALLLLWMIGSGPGAWRAAGSETPASLARETAGQPVTSPAAPAGRTPAGTAPSPAGPAANGGAASGATATASGGTAASGTAGAASNGSAASGPGRPAPTTGAPSGPTRPAADGGATAPSGNGASTNGAAAALPRALPGAPVARLYFGPDQAWPSGEVGPALAPVLARLRAEPDTKALVSGFHDRRGPAEQNAELAQRRAQAVRRVLIREGVATDRIVLARPQQSQGSGPDREARRVEVTLAR
jgi:outer membrane protein OmpA-like peptidoglycan-associated protein